MPHKPRGRVVSKQEFAEFAGKTAETITAWIGRGMPVVESGSKSQSYRINTADAFAWVEGGGHLVGASRAERPKDAKDRKLAADADLAELSLSERRGELVKVDQVTGLVESEYGVTRERLLGITGKLGDVLSPEQSETLENEIYAALEELHDSAGFLDRLGRGGGEAEGEEGDPKTPSEVKPNRMGRAVPARPAKGVRATRKVADRGAARRGRTNVRRD